MLFTPLASEALAQLSTSCEFNVGTQSIDWSISGGNPVWYFVHPVGTGCIESAVEIDSVMGPDASGSFELNCVPGVGNRSGHINIPVCEGENCFINYEFDFNCTPDCDIFIASVPSMTEWGLVVLFSLLVLTGGYLIRRKRATAVR